MTRARATTPDEAVTLGGLYSAAADYIERTHFMNFLGGPEVWTTIHTVVNDRVTGPLTEGFRRQVGADQTQFWRGDEKTAVQILRKLSRSGGQLPLLVELHAEHRIESARQALRAALGMDTGHDLDLLGLVRYLAERLTKAEAENERLRAAPGSRKEMRGSHGTATDR